MRKKDNCAGKWSQISSHRQGQDTLGRWLYLYWWWSRKTAGKRKQCPVWERRPTCMATGKSFCASGGKKMSTAFLVKGWLPAGGVPTSITCIWGQREGSDMTQGNIQTIDRRLLLWGLADRTIKPAGHKHLFYTVCIYKQENNMKTYLTESNFQKWQSFHDLYGQHQNALYSDSLTVVTWQTRAALYDTGEGTIQFTKTS